MSAVHEDPKDYGEEPTCRWSDHADGPCKVSCGECGAERVPETLDVVDPEKPWDWSLHDTDNCYCGPVHSGWPCVRARLAKSHGMTIDELDALIESTDEEEAAEAEIDEEDSLYGADPFQAGGLEGEAA